MRGVFTTTIYDDDGEILGQHELCLDLPQGTDAEEKHTILGEGQQNMAKLAEQAAMHGTWVAARKLVKKIEADQLAGLGVVEEMQAPEVNESTGKTPMDMPKPDA